MLEIRLNHCDISVGSRRIVQDVSTSLEWQNAPGSAQVLGFMGPSGSGKTTLARAVMDARYGSPRVDLELAPPDAVIAYLPQSPVLFNDLSVAQNARLLSKVGRHRHHFDETLFAELASSLRLEQFVAQPTHIEKISGGEAQRLMLLRTLSIKPDLIILDEPATGLDPTVREDFLVDLSAILTRLGICALYITHHWQEIAFLCSQVALAVPPWPHQPQSAIRELPVFGVDDFAVSPPTIDAFIAVHGPGCSAVRLRRNRDIMAYMPPTGRQRRFVPRSNRERLCVDVAQLLKDGAEIKAACYTAGRFTNWEGITNLMLMDPVQ